MIITPQFVLTEGLSVLRGTALSDSEVAEGLLEHLRIAGWATCPGDNAPIGGQSGPDDNTPAGGWSLPDHEAT